MAKIQEDELLAWGRHLPSYFLDVLNKDTDLEEAIENIKSFRNSEFYTGSEEKYKEKSND